MRKIFEDLGVCLGCFGRVSSLAFLRSSTRHQTRHEGTGRLQQTNALPVPIKTGLSWGCFGAQDASKTAQDASKNPKTRQDAPKTPQDAPKTRPRCPQDAPKTPQEVPRRPPRPSQIHPKSILMLKTLKIKKTLKNRWKINDF